MLLTWAGPNWDFRAKTGSGRRLAERDRDWRGRSGTGTTGVGRLRLGRAARRVDPPDAARRLARRRRAGRPSSQGKAAYGPCARTAARLDDGITGAIQPCAHWCTLERREHDCGRWAGAKADWFVSSGDVCFRGDFTRTVAAFANGRGGSIVSGVENGEATVMRHRRRRPHHRARPTGPARPVNRHPPGCRSRHLRDGRQDAAGALGRTRDRLPNGITLPGRKDQPVEFYVRRDATTFPARPKEIRASVPAAPHP